MIYPFFLVNIAVLAFSSNLYGAFASDIQATCGISIQGIGTILSVSQIGTILAFLIYPAILRKYGPYRTMWLGVFGMGLSNILIAFSRTTATFAITFLLSNVIGFIYGSSKSSVCTLCDKEHEDRNIAGMHLTYSISSIAVGYYTAMLKGPKWYLGYVQTGIALFVIGMIFVLMDKEAKTNKDLMASTGHHESLLKEGFSLFLSPAFVCFFLFVVLTASIEGLAVIYPLLFIGDMLGGNGADVGMALSCFYIGMTGSRLLLIPWFSKSKHPKKIITVMTLLCSCSYFAFAKSTTIPMADIALICCGFGSGAINPMANIMEVHLWPDDINQVLNMHSITGTVGKLFIPLILSAVIGKYGEGAGIITLGIGMLSALLFLFISLHMLKAPQKR